MAGRGRALEHCNNRLKNGTREKTGEGGDTEGGGLKLLKKRTMKFLKKVTTKKSTVCGMTIPGGDREKRPMGKKEATGGRAKGGKKVKKKGTDPQ